MSEYEKLRREVLAKPAARRVYEKRLKEWEVEKMTVDPRTLAEGVLETPNLSESINVATEDFRALCESYLALLAIVDTDYIETFHRRYARALVRIRDLEAAGHWFKRQMVVGPRSSYTDEFLAALNHHTATLQPGP